MKRTSVIEKKVVIRDGLWDIFTLINLFVFFTVIYVKARILHI